MSITHTHQTSHTATAAAQAGGRLHARRSGADAAAAPQGFAALLQAQDATDADPVLADGLTAATAGLAGAPSALGSGAAPQAADIATNGAQTPVDTALTATNNMAATAVVQHPARGDAALGADRAVTTAQAQQAGLASVADDGKGLPTDPAALAQTGELGQVGAQGRASALVRADAAARASALGQADGERQSALDGALGEGSQALVPRSGLGAGRLSAARQSATMGGGSDLGQWAGLTGAQGDRAGVQASQRARQDAVRDRDASGMAGLNPPVNGTELASLAVGPSALTHVGTRDIEREGTVRGSAGELGLGAGAGTVDGLAPGQEVTAAGAAQPDQANAETVSYWVQGGVQNARMRLDDATGGPLDVSIALKGEQATLDFRTDQADLRSALGESAPALRDMLAEQGMQLAGYTVGGQSPDGAPRQWRDRDDQSEGALRRSVKIRAAELGAVDAPVAPAVAGHGRRLDVFA